MTSLRWTRGICTPGLSLGFKIRIGACIDWYFLKKKRFPFFFEHNMRFLCYYDALCIQINRFEFKRQA